MPQSQCVDGIFQLRTFPGRCKRSILVVFGASLYETMKKTPSCLVKKDSGWKNSKQLPADIK